MISINKMELERMFQKFYEKGKLDLKNNILRYYQLKKKT